MSDGSGSREGTDRRPVIGASLLRFSDQRQWSDRALADFLGCDAAGLARLALRRCPDAGSDAFEAEVIALADLAGCMPDRLATILRADGHAPR
jgi:hypothetical protein